MDKECMEFVGNVAKFWEKTEDSEALENGMAALSKYTSTVFERVQILELPSNDAPDNESTSDNVRIEIGAENCENEKKAPEKGQNGNKTKDNQNQILEIGTNTVSLETVIKIFDKNVVSSTDFDATRQTSFAFIPGSGHLIYSIADYIANLSHVMPVASFYSPGGCDIEKNVINWVKGIVGYPDTSNGVTVSGSSMGAVIAFSAARDHLLQSSDLYKSAVVYVSNHAHFSNIRALRVVGLGSCVYRYVPSMKHRIVPHELDRMIKKDIENGLMPFMVIATMGGTCMGALDPFEKIWKITRKHNIWIHVDASYGGFFLLDDSVKARCTGINMADSITLDFHKGLSAPYGTAVVMIREGHILSSAMSRENVPYIENYDQRTDYSPIDLSFEVTRPFRAFPVWFMLKVVGIEAVKSQLTEKIQLTKYAYDILSRMENVSVYMEPDLSIIAFRCSKGNEITRKWLELINKEGSTETTSTMANTDVYIRICILSFRTHLKAVEVALRSIKRSLDVLVNYEQNSNL